MLGARSSRGAPTGARSRALGRVTRGTTGVNRLRRGDRWLVHHPDVRRVLQSTPEPLVADVGYGSVPVTTFELAARLRAVAPQTRVVGLEIDPARVVTGGDRVDFAYGGFELAGLHPVLVRAFNVLRQYDESDVPAAWAAMQTGLAPNGLIMDGTCDELGRRCAWILLDKHRPLSLTLAWDPHFVATPSDVAERLPKALIHRNVPGERIFDLLNLADECWARAAGYAPYGPRQRWRAALLAMRDRGVPVHVPRRRLRDCILTVEWAQVAPEVTV
ncbi:hypothetical protein FHU29_001951 [Hoyosella altamirensis]|uniref:SAM-dependent methyltransferase n=1 Tax=Hoyosella altamirensis TaxID=616997 RepID=A0A839RKT9_9ACTN|nr:hypothetical protein [Hoyosella altamirensis]